MPHEVDPFESWVSWLEERHTRALTFQEVRKGVAALSRIYVEERHRLEGSIFDGAGKRAAFACFYTPLHYLLVRQIVRELGAPTPSRIVDLGCGLLPASAAWAHEALDRPRILAVDQSSWTVAEARASLGVLRLSARILKKSIAAAPMPKRGEAVVAAFAVNELPEAARGELRERLLRGSEAGASVLVVEPIARRPAPWWDGWGETFVRRGGRADEWRFPAKLPKFVAALDRAAHLDHHEITGRSLFLPGSPRNCS